MKDRKTHRAVKNILHNELGVTSEKVESLIVDFINKKAEKKLEDFMSSGRFEYMVNRQVEKASVPIVRKSLENQLAGIKINVEFKPKKR